MVFPSLYTPVPSKFPIASTKSQVCQLRNSFPIDIRRQRVSVTYSAKFPMMEHFHDPAKRIAFFNYTKDKLWKFIPGSVKRFPLKKAESVALHKLLVLGKETLKWSLVACFAFNCLSDISYSISRNNELVIPFGLFVGCLLANYFDEIFQEVMHERKDGQVTSRLLGISCFFVIVKLVSMYFGGGNDFLLHTANGGLMQVLCNWKNSPEGDGGNSLSENVSIPTNADN